MVSSRSDVVVECASIFSTLKYKHTLYIDIILDLILDLENLICTLNIVHYTELHYCLPCTFLVFPLYFLGVTSGFTMDLAAHVQFS